jgi:hypothetical protein
LRIANGSESPWPTRVTRIRQKVRKMIWGRPGTSSETARAAAREMAPRIPLQPTAKRSPRVSPASERIAKTKASRVAIEAAAIAATGSSSSLTPEEPSPSESTISGSCTPSRTKSRVSRVKMRTSQKATALRRVSASIARGAW